MRTDSAFGCAVPLVEVIGSLCKKHLQPLLEGDAIVISQGFIASNSEGQTTTLGRGSDSAALLSPEPAMQLQFPSGRTVPGVYTTDPRIVPHAKAIPELTYLEAANGYIRCEIFTPRLWSPQYAAIFRSM